MTTPRFPAVGTDGKVQDRHLPDRLTQKALQDNFTQAPIDLGGRGVSHLKTAAENTPIIQSAIAEASGTGRQILLPYCPPTAWIDVDQELVIPGGMSVIGHGQGRTRIRQRKRMSPIFDVTGSDVEVAGFTGKQTTENPTSAEKASFRGEPGTGRLAVVRVQADRVDVRDVTGIDANAVVHFAAWNVATDIQRTQLEDCTAVNIHSVDCVFGLLAVGVRRFFYDNVTGSYLLRPGWGTPPHLLYFSEGLGDNIDIRGGNASAWNGRNGQAFQFKGVVDGTVGVHAARQCEGVLNLIGNKRLKIESVESIEDTYSGSLYASLVAQGVNENITIGQVIIDMQAGGKPVRILSGSVDARIGRLNITSRHAEALPAGSFGYDIDIDGTRTVIENPTVKNLGTIAWEASIGIFGGTDNRIVRPVTGGNIRGVTIRGSATGSVVEDYTLAEVSGTDRYFSLENAARFFPRPGLDTPTPSRTPVLMEDGTTPSGSASVLNWPQVGPQWSHVAGEWRAYSGVIRTRIPLSNCLAVAPIGKSDIRITTDVIYQDRIGVAARAADRNNLITGRLNHSSGSAEIVKRAGGIETVLASTPVTPVAGQTYRLDFSAMGSRLRLVVNDFIQVDHTLTPEDMALFPSTQHGLFFHATSESGYKNIIMY